MKRKIIAGILSVFLAGTALGYYLLKVYECSASLDCSSFRTDAFALYYGMGMLSVIFVVLLFFPIALRAWGMFAVWMFPLALDVFLFTEGSDGDISGIFAFFPEEIFRVVARVLIVVSMIIIAVSVYRHKTGRRKEPQPWSLRKKVAFWSLWILYVGVIFAPRVFDISYALM